MSNMVRFVVNVVRLKVKVGKMGLVKIGGKGR